MQISLYVPNNCHVTLFSTCHWLFTVSAIQLMVCICCHGGNVGVLNNAVKCLLEFDCIIMQKLWGHFPLSCTPTWPSHHVDGNQELVQTTPTLPDITEISRRPVFQEESHTASLACLASSLVYNKLK